MRKSSFWVANLQIRKHSYSDISFIPIYPPIFSVVLKLQLYLVIMSGMLFWHPIGSVFAVFKVLAASPTCFCVNVKLMLCKLMFLSLNRVDVDSSFIRSPSSPFFSLSMYNFQAFIPFNPCRMVFLCSGPINTFDEKCVFKVSCLFGGHTKMVFLSYTQCLFAWDIAPVHSHFKICRLVYWNPLF